MQSKYNNIENNLHLEQVAEENNNGVDHEDVCDDLIESVHKEIDKIHLTSANSLKNNLMLFVISVFLFARLGIFRNSFFGFFILIVVIFIHELGHFIGMKIFKFKEIQMLFIPFFGAVVSEKNINPSPEKKAIVSLLGPMLGIFIGICTGIAYVATRNEDFIYITRLFLVFNFLNLIPLSVLDGGRFINAVFFTRYPKVELGFNIFTMLVVICVALIFKDIFFGIFAFLIFIPLRALYGVTSISLEIKKQVDYDNNYSVNTIPEKYVRRIVELLKNKIPLEQQTPKLFAINVLRIWQKVCNKLPSILITILLFLLYIFCLIISFCSFTIFDSIVSAITQK